MEEGEEEENETDKGERGFGDRVPETSMELIVSIVYFCLENEEVTFSTAQQLHHFC